MSTGKGIRIDCQCKRCGGNFRVVPSKIKGGRGIYCSRSCRSKAVSLKHGMSRTRLGIMLGNMVQRCTNESSPEYKNYGGRGISICDEWMDDPSTFYDWAKSSGWHEECQLEIDRKENDKGYCPTNCRFVTKLKNQQNRRKKPGLSKYRGVWWDKDLGMWRAVYSESKGKRKSLGCFASEEDAAVAWDDHAVKQGREPHILNFPLADA